MIQRTIYACTAERLTKHVGQDIIVFTSDQQLYRVAGDIYWSQPTIWYYALVDCASS